MPWDSLFVLFKMLVAPLRPAKGQLHGLPHARGIRWIFRALIERHDDIRADDALDVDADTGFDSVGFELVVDRPAPEPFDASPGLFEADCAMSAVFDEGIGISE